MEKSPCNRGIPTILGLAVFYRQYKRIALYANGVPTAQKTSRSVTYVYNKIVRHVCIFLYRDKNAVILFLLCRIFFFLFFFQYIIAFLRGARGSVEPQNSKQSGEFWNTQREGRGERKKKSLSLHITGAYISIFEMYRIELFFFFFFFCKTYRFFFRVLCKVDAGVASTAARVAAAHVFIILTIILRARNGRTKTNISVVAEWREKQKKNNYNNKRFESAPAWV